MFILDASAYLCEVGPFIFEGVCPAFEILFQSWFIDFWVIGKVAFDVGDLLKADIFFFDIAECVQMELCVEAEKHLGVVEVAAFSHCFIH